MTVFVSSWAPFSKTQKPHSWNSRMCSFSIESAHQVVRDVDPDELHQIWKVTSVSVQDETQFGVQNNNSIPNKVSPGLPAWNQRLKLHLYSLIKNRRYYQIELVFLVRGISHWCTHFVFSNVFDGSLRNHAYGAGHRRAEVSCNTEKNRKL